MWRRSIPASLFHAAANLAGDFQRRIEGRVLPGIEAISQRAGKSLCEQIGLKPGMLGHRESRRRVNIDRLAGGAGLGAHGNGIAGDHQQNLITQTALLNVVQEMAIASGAPTPPVYLLDNEAGINAFAAGLLNSVNASSIDRSSASRFFESPF